MADPPSTMAPLEAAAPSHTQSNTSTTSNSRTNNPAIETTPSEPTKFNPIPAMSQLLQMMLKDEPSLVLQTTSNDKQVILATTPLPTTKTEFQKFFNVSTTHMVNKNQSNICIGCKLLSNHNLGNI